MQLGMQSIPPVGILLDCDLGNDIEDALAMALLYGLDGKNECRFAGTTISRPGLRAAALCDAIARFYAGEVSAAFNAAGRTLPVGLPVGKSVADGPMLAVLDKMNAEGKPLYPHNIVDITDTANPVDVLRNGLSAQHPKNAIVVCSGPLSNLAALIHYPHAKAMAEERCRLLVIAADPVALKADIGAARKVLTEWPSPVVVVGPEVGASVRFPAASLDEKFAWSPAHPVVDAYRAFRSGPYDAPTTAMAAVLYVARSKDSLFQLSEPGTIAVSDDGQIRFTAGSAGKHRTLTVDPAKKDQVQQIYIELASAKPVPKMPRRRLSQQQQQQQPEKAAAAAAGKQL